MAKTCLFCGGSNEDSDQFCRGCGANLAGAQQPTQEQPVQPVQPVQPTNYNQPASNQAQGKTNGTAIAALVVSIVGLIILPLPCGIISVSLAATSFNHLKQFPTEKGKGMAVAGLVIGIIDIVWWVLAILVLANQ